VVSGRRSSNGVQDWVGGWDGRRFTHEGFVFSDEDEVRARVVPFVEEGLSRDEPVIVVADDAVRDVLTSELGPRIDELAIFASSREFWVGGHDSLAAHQRNMKPFLDAGSPWRLVGQPSWLDQPGGEVWSRFEAVANEALADYPYYSLCLHDRRRLPAEAIATQMRVHPLVWDGDGPVPNPGYMVTEAFLDDAEPAWQPGPDVRTLVVHDLAGGPSAVAAWLDLGRMGSRRADVRLAVHEVVVNALQAAGAAEVSEWYDDGSAVWQVRDSGPGVRDRSLGYVLAGQDLASGRGLWTARRLADDSALRSTDDGTTVQLMFRTEPRMGH
jgi:anti-sigma regulatory factor (Ser/Thr protein kinase)